MPEIGPPGTAAAAERDASGDGCRALMPTGRSRRGGSGDQHEARAAELACFCEFCRDMPGVHDRGFLIHVLISGLVQTKTVFVHDMEEVAHAHGVGGCAASHQ